MKILTVSQIQQVDQLTIERQSISSIDLMERVAKICSEHPIWKHAKNQKIFVFCGMGNNGGDGLAIARLLSEKKYNVHIVIVKYRPNFSDEAKFNFERLPEPLRQSALTISTQDEINTISLQPSDWLVDALLGTGTNKPTEGILKSTIERMNHSRCFTISIDIPSGLFADQSSKNNLDACVHSNFTMTLQQPKMCLLMAENSVASMNFEIMDIGLDRLAIEEQVSTMEFVEKTAIATLLQPRNKFSHKGTFGHGLLLAGSKGKAGAAIIASEACLRSGAGLLTVHSIKQVIQSLSIRLPEVMTYEDDNDSSISYCGDFTDYNAIGFGPGVGINEDTHRILRSILMQVQQNLVIDADGINILAENPTWLEFLPRYTILTPHPKEFQRLIGKEFTDNFDRLKKAQDLAQKYGCILILKDAYTAICMPDGRTFFNSSGNPGLSKSGSGDALTGILLGLLTRGYHPRKAALIGVYVHGLAADVCAQEMSQESMLITDVIQKLPRAFKELETDV